MYKTSVYLNDEARKRLASVARRLGTSQADVIRRAIVSYEPPASGDRDFQLFAVADGPGGSIADVPEDELFKNFAR